MTCNIDQTALFYVVTAAKGSHRSQGTKERSVTVIHQTFSNFGRRPCWNWSVILILDFRFAIWLKRSDFSGVIRSDRHFHNEDTGMQWIHSDISWNWNYVGLSFCRSVERFRCVQIRMIAYAGCSTSSVVTLQFASHIDNEWHQDRIAYSTPLFCSHRLAAEDS
jgi:hypothetical protein